MKPTINPNVPVINTDKPEDYKVKHKEIIYKTPDGVLKQKNEVYAIKGTGKNTEEILLGNIKQNAVLKSTKKSKMVYNTSDGYIAIDKDGNTIGVYKTQKAAKQYMLDKYLAEKGIIQKAKEPMKVTPGSQTKTPDPINPVVEPPKEVKLKLMDEVTFNLNGKDVTGKILDIDKKTGLLDIIHDKQVYEIHKDKVIKTEATKVEPLKKPTSKKPATKPITAKKPADDKQLPNPNVGQIDFDSYRKLESFDQDIHRDSFTISKMNSKDKSWIRKYTSNFYSKMNTYLRRNKTDKDDVFEAIDNLRRVLNVNAKGLSQDTVFFRKIGRESIRHIFSQEISDVLHEASNGDSQAIEKAKKMLIGGAMEDKAFMSTTYKYGSFGSSMDLDIEIYSPKGYKGGMFVESISEYSDEKEYVFNSGKKFDIVDLVIDGRKTILRLIPTN